MGWERRPLPLVCVGIRVFWMAFLHSIHIILFCRVIRRLPRLSELVRFFRFFPCAKCVVFFSALDGVSRSIFTLFCRVIRRLVEIPFSVLVVILVSPRCVRSTLSSQLL